MGDIVASRPPSGWFDKSARPRHRIGRTIHGMEARPVKRIATSALIGIAIAGCGGGQEAAAPTKPEATAVNVVEAKPVAQEHSSGPTPVKKNDDPPGFLLPDDPEAVGAKPPELPIR
jgi:hypothetical protein